MNKIEYLIAELDRRESVIEAGDLGIEISALNNDETENEAIERR